MIAWIKGSILKKTKNSFLIVNQNIAYEIFIGQKELQKYQQKEEISLFVFSLWKDKWFEFYGFSTLEEKDLFQLLLTVGALGPKSAYKIIQSYPLDQIVYAIANKENIFFEKISGIGTKTAAKIIIELEKKITKFAIKTTINHNDSIKNTFSTLQQLGFDDKSILQSIQRVLESKKADQSFEFFLKQCLKQLKK